MSTPDDRRYTKEHEWVQLGDDGLAVVGITEYAQEQLGDIVYLDIEQPGTAVEADGVFGTIEAVKTVSELFSPLAGTIEEVNESLDASPESINQDPYGSGWMVKIRPDNAGDVEALMSAEEYRHMIGSDD
ncbi:glycine cleavage system protein GcvH [soil metagenome]